MLEKQSYFPKYRIKSELTSLNEWKKIFKNKNYRNYNKRSIIVNQGEDVNDLYFIVKGLVEYTYINENGEEELLEILGDGNIFCLQPIFGQNPSVASFIALEDSLIASINISEVKKYLSTDKGLANELFKELSKITNGLTRQIFSQRLSAEERVKETIYCLAEYYRKRQNDYKEAIFIPFSQNELGKISRTTRVTVTKVIAVLKKLKLINTLYGGIVVYDLNKIRR